jgi:predicted nucleic acid-binding protein
VRNVLVDTGPLVAAIDRGDPWHPWAIGELRKSAMNLATVWPAVTEAAYLLSKTGPHGPSVLLKALADNEIEIAGQESSDFISLRYLLDEYADLPMDLADAALVHAYERDSFDAVMTVDRRDFLIYRVRGKALRLIAPGA